MLPKEHILLGALFSFFIYYFFNVGFLNAFLIFLASVFIDIDHYLFFILKFKNYSLKKAYLWHEKLRRNHKPIMHIFHTIEFLFIIFLFSFISQFFLFILIGLLFHSITNLFEMIYSNSINAREYSLVRYLINKKKDIYL